MRAARKTSEEQYRLVMECRQSGLADCDWCRENGININTFYAWVRRLRKEACHPIPAPGRHHADNGICANEVVRVEILPEERQAPSDTKDNPVLLPTAGGPMIEIEADGILFRFTGTVDASLYEKTLLMIGGRHYDR